MALPELLSCGGKEAGPVSGPDLRARSIGFLPVSPDSGQEIVGWLVIENDGSAEAPQSVAEMTIDGVSACPHLPVHLLAPGESDSVTCSIGRRAVGAHPVQACADADAAVTEQDEGNNCLSAVLHVSPAPPPGRPDLQVGEIGFLPARPGPADSVRVTAAVSDAGTASSPACVASVEVDGSPRCAQIAIPPLAVGEVVHLACNLGRVSSGNHPVRVCADADSLVAESDEGNNCGQITLPVSLPDSGPDLLVLRVLFDPEAPTQTQPVTVMAVIQNQGTEAAGATITRISIDSASHCGGVATRGIMAGDTAMVSCNVGRLAPGPHPVEVEADAANAVSETDELNNTEDRLLVVSGGRP